MNIHLRKDRYPGVLPPFRGMSRREWLRTSGNGFGMLALASLLGGAAGAGSSSARAAAGPQSAGGRFPAKAKSCIYLFMTGGPSHVDLFDPKPELTRLNGEPLPPSFGKVTSQFVEKDPLCMGSRRKFGKFGDSGLEMSDLVPHLNKVADELAVIRSCHCDSVVHAPAMYQMNTGRVLMGYPSLGSWATYGLGSLCDDLPAFVVMTQPQGTPEGGAPCWGSGFLPASFQGTPLGGGEAPILNLTPSRDRFSHAQRSATLDLIRSMDRSADPSGGDSELKARLDSYELAFRMQAKAPEVVDLSRESAETRALYGIDNPATAEFGTRCLLARRLVERGVRFVQLYSGGGPVAWQWDAHDDIDVNHEKMCGLTDQPVAALVLDLKRRGLLDETLVIWGGEFGRTPVSQGAGRGRDHNAAGFTLWMAGGGIKGGVAYGATDAIGLKAVEKPAHVNDIHATVLHLMGLDHRLLTFFHNGRDERLTDVGGQVLHEILA